MFVPDLVGNSGDKFFREETHLTLTRKIKSFDGGALLVTGFGGP